MDRDNASRITFARRRIALAAGTLLFAAVVVALLTGGGSPHAHPTAPPRRAAAPAVSQAPAATLAAREAAAVERVRQRFPFIVGGGSKRREVALTFDDGPGPYTPAVLDALELAHAPATFFVVTQMLRYFKPTLVRAVRAGFVIGDHTASHPLLAHMSRIDQIVQIDGAAAAIEDAGAPVPNLFRPPYGSYDRKTLGVLDRGRRLGVLWTVDARDFARPGADAIVRAVMAAVRPGAIIELHDAGGDRRETVAALPVLIRRLRRQGYTLVTVPRLMLDDPPLRRQPLPPGVGTGPVRGPGGVPVGP